MSTKNNNAPRIISPKFRGDFCFELINMFLPLTREIAFKLPANLSARNLTDEHRHLSLYPSQPPLNIGEGCFFISGVSLNLQLTTGERSGQIYF